jgi:glycosyltransferase involved in cell wall biosynthesis
MNILWFTNLPLPEASMAVNEKFLPFGGWTVLLSKFLSDIDGVKLSIGFQKKGINEVQIIQGEKITYYVFPYVFQKDIKSHQKDKHIQEIISKAKPDITHIFGTEYPHALVAIRCCDIKKTVVSLHGLTSIIAKHYFASLPINVLERYTFRDFVKNDNIITQRDKMAKRGIYEHEILNLAQNVMGRTTWDYACARMINPKAKYYFCNETLRDEFYKNKWDINKCRRHSIFVSQTHYPLKGLHYILEALPVILREFPDTILYIGGVDITKTETLKDKLKLSSYGKYLIYLIKKHNLKDKLVFLGLLDEAQMCNQFLKANVFASMSTVENESNSLSEAKILGVPCVASYAGGVTDRIEHDSDGFFYQHDAPYMLAHYISEIFGNDDLAIKFSNNAAENAHKRHDKKKNTDTLFDIYNRIVGD